MILILLKFFLRYNYEDKMSFFFRHGYNLW